MANDEMQNETFEDARVVFRNFSGREGKYNREGDRNFAILLEDDRANDLIDKGWTVKYLRPREDGDEPKPYLPVTVKYSPKARPPKVVLITSRGKNMLDEGLVGTLDFAEIKNADLIVRPYQWDVNGATGVKAYLQSIFVTIYEDELDLKYADTPDSAAGPSPDEYDGVHFE